MRELIKRLSILISVCIIALFAVCLTNNNGGNNSIDAPVRDVELVENNVDYQKIISDFDDSKIIYKENEKNISFVGHSIIKQSDFEDIDFVALTNNNDSNLIVAYNFEYLENINLFILKVEIENVDGGIILDSVEGVPCLNDKGEIDIVFDVDGEIVLLNDLVNNGILQQCGWFKKALKKLYQLS